MNCVLQLRHIYSKHQIILDWYLMRELSKNDYTQEEKDNLLNGNCWCGKPKSEFDKHQKIYCCTEHATEWYSRTVVWSVFRDNFVSDHGEKCDSCGITPELIKQSFGKKVKQWYSDIKKDPDMRKHIEQLRLEKLAKLDEEYKTVIDIDAFIKDWEYSLRNDSPKIAYPSSDDEYCQFQLDHIIAVALGGDNWNLKNLQLLCIKCHKKKTKQDMVLIKNKRKGQKMVHVS